VNTISIANGVTAAIFAATAMAGHAQTGWHPATQSDKSMATPGATSGEPESSKSNGGVNKTR
jgi:hypothetical protein